MKNNLGVNKKNKLNVSTVLCVSNKYNNQHPKQFFNKSGSCLKGAKKFGWIEK